VVVLLLDVISFFTRVLRKHARPPSTAALIVRRDVTHTRRAVRVGGPSLLLLSPSETPTTNAKMTRFRRRLATKKKPDTKTANHHLNSRVLCVCCVQVIPTHSPHPQQAIKQAKLSRGRRLQSITDTRATARSARRLAAKRIAFAAHNHVAVTTGRSSAQNTKRNVCLAPTRLLAFVRRAQHPCCCCLCGLMCGWMTTTLLW
jgi:hypothetical protein